MESRLAEMAEANSHQIQCEDKSVQEALQFVQNLQGLQWNSRMSEFIKPILKLRSSVNDLKLQLGPLLKDNRLKLESAKELMVRKMKPGSWKRTTCRMLGRRFCQIECDLKFCAEPKVKALKAYRRKARKFVIKRQEEEQNHLLTENSSKIMDPDLNPNIIKHNISIGMKVFLIANCVYVEYLSLLVDCMSSKDELNKRTTMCDEQIAILDYMGPDCEEISSDEFVETDSESEMVTPTPQTTKQLHSVEQVEAEDPPQQ